MIKKFMIITAKWKLNQVYEYYQHKKKIKFISTYLLDRPPRIKAKGKGGMKGNQWNGRNRKDKLIKECFYKELCLSNPSTPQNFHSPLFLSLSLQILFSSHSHPYPFVLPLILWPCKSFCGQQFLIYDYESVNGKREARENLRNGWHRKEGGFAIANDYKNTKI